jgi:hypothetical protein
MPPRRSGPQRSCRLWREARRPRFWTRTRLSVAFRAGEGLGCHEHHDDLFCGTERFSVDAARKADVDDQVSFEVGRASRSGGWLGADGLQDRPHYLAERHRGVDLAVRDCPQQRFDYLNVCQEPAGLFG